VLARLVELRAADVDAGHVSRRSDQFGEHLRHGANAAAASPNNNNAFESVVTRLVGVEGPARKTPTGSLQQPSWTQ
jgi:hypothetical protein